MNSSVETTTTAVVPPTASSNQTASQNIETFLDNPNFAWILFALALVTIWVVYITYFNSRIIGYLLTRFLNSSLIRRHFLPRGYLKIGSFSISVLSGKIMFRNIVYVNEDYSMRIQDGWAIFRWWKKYKKRSIHEDLSHSDTRLSVLVNGYELHFYNRSQTYSRLERLFGLDSRIFPSGESEKHQTEEEESCVDNGSQSTNGRTKWARWRDLIPVIKIDISSGRLVFGNRLLPTTLLVSVEEAHMMYTTKPASTRFDQFMHTIKCKAENFKVILAPSPSYTGMEDEPPRFMGEGFTILQSNRMDLYYYMDEPGPAPNEPEFVELADGNLREATLPVLGLDIKCGKATDISYGPWADRQREQLFKFFFPQDFQPMVPDRVPQPGELRQPKSFDIRVSTLADSTIDILFSKLKETMAVHVNIRAGSYLEVTIPWVVQEHGYVTRINGQLMHLEATTSLQYRTLVQSETLEFDVRVMYPLIWNHHQKWNINLTGCKATVHFIFSHKGFFQDLMNDWSSRSRPDILHFVPYTCHFSLILKEFEAILISNEYNWIDCSSQHQENAHVGACGELLELTFDLPFTEFLPPTVPIRFWIQAESASLQMYLPEVNTYRSIVLSLDRNCKLTKRDGTLKEKPSSDKKWRNVTKGDGWVECWAAPIVALGIVYTYHPSPYLGPSDLLKGVTTPEKEEILLNPMRPPTSEVSGCKSQSAQSTIPGGCKMRPNAPFDPESLPPDTVVIELEIGPSIGMVYGSLLRNLLNVKENYLGYYLSFTDFESPSKTGRSKLNDVFDGSDTINETEFDPRVYRPMDVTVSLVLHDVQAHLMKNCSADDPPCPTVSLERFNLELRKSYRETTLQVMISPIILSSTDSVQRPESHRHLKNGYLVVSGLQIRAHAMFSDAARSLSEDTLEYAWLVDIQLSHVIGRLTAPQLQHVINSLELFAFLAEDSANALHPVIPYQECHHGISQHLCAETTPQHFCPAPEDIKYKMTRFAVDEIDLYLVETRAALNLQLLPIRAAQCNLHNSHLCTGTTAILRRIHLRQLVASTSLEGTVDTWLEVGGVSFGPLCIDSALSQPRKDLSLIQHAYLKKHDMKSRRLIFLWNSPTATNQSPMRSQQSSEVKDNKRLKCACWDGHLFATDAEENGKTDFFNNGVHVVVGKPRPSSDRQETCPPEKVLQHRESLPSPMSSVSPPSAASRLSLGVVAQENVVAVPPSASIGSFRRHHTAGHSRAIGHSTAMERRRSNGLRDSRATSATSLPAAGASLGSASGNRASATPSPCAMVSHADDDEMSIRVRRATSIGDESVHSVDLFYLADDRVEPVNILAPTTNMGTSLAPVAIGDETNSLSSTSFISAMSSQEDLATVDLHTQLNKPITESPLLMFSYTSHMTRLQCNNWCSPSPQPHDFLPFGATSSGTNDTDRRWAPIFDVVSEGFTVIRMVDKDALPSASAEKVPTTQQKEEPFEEIEDKLRDDFEENDSDAVNGDDGAHKSTIVVNLKGDIDVHVSPLMLETSQRFIESVLPTLASIHALTVINHLRCRCSAAVESNNELKKDKYRVLYQMQDARKSADLGDGGKAPRTQNLQHASSPTATVTGSSIFEESNLYQSQVFFTIGKINVSVIQASIVEEITSFSALDNMRDVTCVSVLLLCLDRVSGRFFQSKLFKRSIQVLQAERRPEASLRYMKDKSSKKVKVEWVPTDQPVAVETSDVLREEFLCTVDVRRIHVQLRRLRNSSTVLKDAVLTVVPGHRSKVFFTFQKVNASESHGASMQADAFGTGSDQSDIEDKMGFIMLECGLEQLTLRTVKRTGFDEKEVDPPPNTQDSGETSGLGFAPSSSTAKKTTEDDAEQDVLSPNNGQTANSTLPGDAGSCLADIGVVWFNFAAPPSTPSAHKIEFNRLDWHLLSTATPAINAWLNPTDRLLVTLHEMVRIKEQRVNAVVACLMASGALDAQDIHLPVKRKYNKVTPLALTLREDPSCQLLTVLDLYVHSDPDDLQDLERYLAPGVTPSLETLRKGLVALSRQWKNALYMPLLMEQNLRLRRLPKPTAGLVSAATGVAFTTPLRRSSPDIHDAKDSVSLADDEDCEQVDENTRLLRAREVAISTAALAGNSASAGSPSSLSPPLIEGKAATLPYSNAPRDPTATPSAAHDQRKKLPSFVPRSTRASVAFPIRNDDRQRLRADYHPSISSALLNADSPARRHRRRPPTQKCTSDPSIGSGSLGPSNPVLDLTSLPTSPRMPQDEDLYRWMAKHQDNCFSSTRVTLDDDDEDDDEDDDGDDDEDDEDPSDDAPSSLEGAGGAGLRGFNMAQPMVSQLADAHVIFRPLLTALGIPGHRKSSVLSQALGRNLAVRAALKSLRIDIVESDAAYRRRKRGRVHMQESSSEGLECTAPAFVCERLSIEADLREIRDLEKLTGIRNESGDCNALNRRRTTVVSADGLHRRCGTLAVNLCVDVHRVCQQVNLPLLRLLHQLFLVYQNAMATQTELRESRPGFRQDNLREVGTIQVQTHAGKDGSSTASVAESQASVVGAKTSPPASPTVVNLRQHSMEIPDGINVRRGRSLTRRLRVSAKGYSSLLSHSTASRSIPPPAAVATAAASSTECTPLCWKKMVYLLNLYATMPETKTVANRSPVAPPDVSDGYRGNGKYEPLKEHHVDIDEVDTSLGRGLNADGKFRPTHLRQQSVPGGPCVQSSSAVDRVTLVVFGVFKIHCTRLLATLSGLKLEAELSSLQASHTYKECVKGSAKKWAEMSATGHLGNGMVVLLEGIPPSQQTIVKVTLGKTQALYSSLPKKSKEKNSMLVTIGPVNVDIPQHPVALHGMMTRSSKQLSSTLQELRVARTATRLSSRVSDESDAFGGPGVNRSPRPSLDGFNKRRQMGHSGRGPIERRKRFLQPIAVHFNIILDSLTIGAALLPSLRAQYQMCRVTSSGVTGNKAKFTVDLAKHTLSFATKVQVAEANLPSSASVDLPLVHLLAEYVQQGSTAADPSDLQFVDGAVLRRGNYFSAVAEIGGFEHSLTTDLLNHLVFVQKVFMKEVNEVVQKMSGKDKPVRLWGEEDKTSVRSGQLLYSLHLRLKSIQITATTPTSSAVRLETGIMELQLSNRVQNISGSAGVSGNYAAKLFGKAHVDLNLSLGQLLKNSIFEEAEPEFQQLAYFKTRIALRNALQDEMVSNCSGDKEAVLITLHRPLIYIQPIALDRAVLVWLNYKNAYEYWNEQRSSLNTEVQTATQQVFERVPPLSQLGAQNLGTLFLQLTVTDLGICLPLNPFTAVGNRLINDVDPRAACVVTLESTRISACSSGSLVSKACFSGLCIRFADDFETSLDDWKPDPGDPNIMNLCVVSEGTYEVCSRTIVPQGSDSAKWILNVKWEMEGVAIHVDTNIGKHLSALAHTLTSLAGSQTDVDTIDLECTDGHRISTNEYTSRKGSMFGESLPDFVFDATMDSKKRSWLIEKAMNEQAKVVNDLKLLGAKRSTIQEEIQHLQELEAVVFKDFRRDVIKRLRRQSVRQASSIRGKLGLSSKGTSVSRSKSIALPTRGPVRTPDTPAAGSTSPVDLQPTPGSSTDSTPTHPGGHVRTVSLDRATVPSVTFDDSIVVRRDLALDESWPYTPLPSLSSSQGSASTISGSGPQVFSLLTTPIDESPVADIGEGTRSTIQESPTVESNYSVEDETTSPGASSGFSGSAMTGPKQQLVAEPSIDFELDIKVFINSGKCILHTKDFREEEQKSQKGIRRERSFSSGTVEFPISPVHRKRVGNIRQNVSSSKLRFVSTPQGQTADFTLFLIPGLDVKLHYNSRTMNANDAIRRHSVHGTSIGPTTQSYPLAAQNASKKPGVKRASLFAWMTLQSIAEETVITPHILDFLEKALDPIPIPVAQAKSPAPPAEVLENEFETTASGHKSSVSAMPYTSSASFPVDVVVYLRILPSTLRFSCLPVSRVECQLRLPSLDLVISTKRSEDDPGGMEYDSATTSLRRGGREGSRATTLAEFYLTQAVFGGLSVTACLSDFSVYIFHPYGGKKSASSGSSKDVSSEASPSVDSDRKDALSVQVEFVKVNISRSRKVSIGLDPACSAGGAVVRFSTVVDIGSASFKYDMRRLTEILAFPKAWYRRTIVRRLFLGDENTSVLDSDQGAMDSFEKMSRSSSSSSNGSDVLLARVHDAPNTKGPPRLPFSTLEGLDGSAEVLLRVPGTGSKLASREKLTLPLGTVTPRVSPKLPQIHESTSRKRLLGRRSSSVVSTPPHSAGAKAAGSSWETLVLFGVNLSKLNIHMNMGNVMGICTWTTRELQSQGRLSIGSSGHKNMALQFVLGGSSLDAKGGIVGGAIELSLVSTNLHIKEDPGQEPQSRIALQLFALESRLDYMGTSVLMGRVSSLDVKMNDDWQVNAVQRTESNRGKMHHDDDTLPTKRPAHILIHGDLGWDQLQLLLSQSTTPDLIKMYSRLEEFFTQQFNSSKRVLSSLQPHFPHLQSRQQTMRGERVLGNRKRNSVTVGNPRGEAAETRHHRHWQSVLTAVSGLRLPTLSLPLPRHGTIVGGSVGLHGNHISLACFHGMNFRSKSWALFSLREPNIFFSTEAQDIINPAAQIPDTHIVQSMSLTLGHDFTDHVQRASMATVCRISRNIVFPPQFRTMQEWFHYVFVTSELDEVDRFPTLERERRDSLTSPDGQQRTSSGSKIPDLNHQKEVIFALPRMQLQLKTEHLQTGQTPDPNGIKPVVMCSFVTEFEDHIYVAVDAEAFFFLHNLITSYIKEKDKAMSGILTPTLASRRQFFASANEKLKSQSPDGERKRKVPDPTEALQKDWREFECKTWHLEPTVRFLAWAVKQIEPCGIDYILNKLGFSHARVTIPKWMQRGAMDPLDKILSLLVKKIVCAAHDSEVTTIDGHGSLKRY